jgi:hypothetical protein
LSVGDVLFAVSEARLTLKASKGEDTLMVYPPENISPELARVIRRYKADIIRVLREDEEMRRTGVIQSERQIFELARRRFGLNGKGDAA